MSRNNKLMEQEEIRKPNPLFQKTENIHVNAKTEKVDIKIDEQLELKRKTYYLTREQIDALDVMALLTGKDKSEIIRDILSKSELMNYKGKKLGVIED